MIRIEVVPACAAAFTRVGALSIAFTVDRVLELTGDADVDGWQLRERPIDVPFVKDYDAIAGESPARWAERFDVSNWAVLMAYTGDELVGTAVVARSTPGVFMLEDRDDLAVLWDLRVHPDGRRGGVGRLLFERAGAWARERHASLLKIETQNVNVPACRFYAAMGCTLGGVNRFAYPRHAGEVQLLWYKTLA